MKKLWIALIAPPAIVLFVWLFGEFVMHLWNWLLPPLFGWHIDQFLAGSRVTAAVPDSFRELGFRRW